MTLQQATIQPAYTSTVSVGLGTSSNSILSSSGLGTVTASYSPTRKFWVKSPESIRRDLYERERLHRVIPKYDRDGRPMSLRINHAIDPGVVESRAPIVSIPSRKCLFCQKAFEGMRSDSKYCSTLCRVKSFQHRKNPSMRSSRGRPKIMY